MPGIKVASLLPPPLKAKFPLMSLRSYVAPALLKTYIISCARIGILLAARKPTAFVFVQTKS